MGNSAPLVTVAVERLGAISEHAESLQELHLRFHDGSIPLEELPPPGNRNVAGRIGGGRSRRLCRCSQRPGRLCAGLSCKLGVDERFEGWTLRGRSVVGSFLPAGCTLLTKTLFMVQHVLESDTEFSVQIRGKYRLKFSGFVKVNFVCSVSLFHCLEFLQGFTEGIGIQFKVKMEKIPPGFYECLSSAFHHWKVNTGQLVSTMLEQ